MTSHDESRIIFPVGDDPVSAVAGVAELVTLCGTEKLPGVEFVTAGELTRAASGAGARKRAGYFRSPASVLVRRHLAETGRALFQPHAEAVTQSLLEAGLDVPVQKRVDTFAMIPGGQTVVVVDLKTDEGSGLLAGEYELPYVIDRHPPAEGILRVQRANALDVFAVCNWLWESR